MRLASIFLNMQLCLFSVWIWKAISHSHMLCQFMQLGPVQSSLNQYLVSNTVLFSPPTPTITLSKIDVGYILLLGFSSLPLSSTQEIFFVFDEKKQHSLHLVRQNTHASLQIYATLQYCKQ